MSPYSADIRVDFFYSGDKFHFIVIHRHPATATPNADHTNLSKTKWPL
jgi:hypothetical protein